MISVSKIHIYIFDIDGCIMPHTFPNFKTKLPRETIVKQVNQRGKTIYLYPNFLKFFKKHCVNSKGVYFITGRCTEDFGWLTETQLRELKRIKLYMVVYYPKNREHTEKLYYNWKVNRIIEIINNTNAQYKHGIYHHLRPSFLIFDDDDGYFSKLSYRIEHKEIEVKGGLIKIGSDNEWKELLNKKEVYKSGKYKKII